MIKNKINYILNFLNNIYSLIKSHFIHYSNYILIGYLPFFENKEGLTDFYFVHIRVGWMEWIVYKYEYDIILDKYILAYITFLYIQFLILLPFYYLYVVKNKFLLDPAHMDRIVFFRYFNNIIDIFAIIDVLILITFYWVWPMSALSHSLFFKVLNKAVFAGAIVLFLFYYQFNLMVIAIVFVKYSWRQVVIIITQFTIINVTIYIMWELYHEYYSMKLFVFLAFQCIHAYSLNGWNYWYTEFDFDEIWRLGPEFEGWIWPHEFREVQILRKAKIKKILEYEDNKYAQRVKEKQEAAEKKRQEKQKLKEEGKLNIFIIIFDWIVNILTQIYNYFTYYDIELKARLEKELKDNFISKLRSEDYRNKLINLYFNNVPKYYPQALGDHWELTKSNIIKELYEITHEDQYAEEFYEKFHRSLQVLEYWLIRDLKISYKMHMDYYVLDKYPMTFYEFLSSLEDRRNFVRNRRKLVEVEEDLQKITQEEEMRTYEQLLELSGLTFLRANLRFIILLNEYSDRYKKDKVLWNKMFFSVYTDAVQVMVDHNISKGKSEESMRELLEYQQSIQKQFNLTDEELDKQDLINEEEQEIDDDIDEMETESIVISDNTHPPFLISNVLNYEEFTIMEEEEFVEEYYFTYDEYFLDYLTEEEKRQAEEFRKSLWTKTFEKWKQLEEEDDYFKYSNFKQMVWYYDIEFHVIGAYLFYWILSYDPLWWFIIPVYGPSNMLS
jgi:hypothetical protein